MSEPIVWKSGERDEHGAATIDGVEVEFVTHDNGLFSVWTASREAPYIEINLTPDRDIAARAVVAAVRVMRGER